MKRKRLNKGAGYGLEIAIIHTFNGHEKANEWIKSKIQEDIKLEQSMKNLLSLTSDSPRKVNLSVN